MNHIFLMLREHDFHQRKTAAALGISEKGLRNHIKVMRKLGYPIRTSRVKKDPAPKAKVIDINVTCFPTNEERLRYLDRRIK